MDHVTSGFVTAFVGETSRDIKSHVSSAFGCPVKDLDKGDVYL